MFQLHVMTFALPLYPLFWKPFWVRNLKSPGKYGSARLPRSMELGYNIFRIWLIWMVSFAFSKKKCLYLPFIHLYTQNLLHYDKAGYHASSVELLDDLRFILSRCKEQRTRTSCFTNWYELKLLQNYYYYCLKVKFFHSYGNGLAGTGQFWQMESALVRFLIPRRSFQQWRWIVISWSSSNLEKTM